MSTIKDSAWPETVSPEVKAVLEEWFHYSNASSAHNEHAAGNSTSELPRRAISDFPAHSMFCFVSYCFIPSPLPIPPVGGKTLL